jgi:hypothetical protein
VSNLHLPYLFILQYLSFKLGMALHDLGTLCGNEFLTKPRCAKIQGCATLKLAETNSYSAEKRLLVSAWVHERELTGQVVTSVQPAGNNKTQSVRASL